MRVRVRTEEARNGVRMSCKLCFQCLCAVCALYHSLRIGTLVCDRTGPFRISPPPSTAEYPTAAVLYLILLNIQSGTCMHTRRQLHSASEWVCTGTMSSGSGPISSHLLVRRAENYFPRELPTFSVCFGCQGAWKRAFPGNRTRVGAADPGAAIGPLAHRDFPHRHCGPLCAGNPQALD